MWKIPKLIIYRPNRQIHRLLYLLATISIFYLTISQSMKHSVWPKQKQNHWTKNSFITFEQYQPNYVTTTLMSFLDWRQKNQNLSSKYSKWLFIDWNPSDCFRFIRYSSARVYLRHSKRLKQLEVRMEKMAREGLHDTVIDREASPDHFLSTLSSNYT